MTASLFVGLRAAERGFGGQQFPRHARNSLFRKSSVGGRWREL
jgi:hypothetical protein